MTEEANQMTTGMVQIILRTCFYNLPIHAAIVNVFFEGDVFNLEVPFSKK